MDPSKHQQILLNAVFHDLVLVGRFASIASTDLIGDQKTADEKRVINVGPAQYATHLKATARVGVGHAQELSAEIVGDEYRPDRIAILEVGCWSESVSLGS